MIRTFIALISAALLAGTSCERDIHKAPEAVARTFDTMYPGAEMVEWERQMGNYTADFFFDGHEMEAQFDKNGTWLWSKTELLLSEVPEAVKQAIDKENDGKWTVDDIEYYTRSSGETEYYRVTLEKEYSEIERILYIRPEGTLFKYNG